MIALNSKLNWIKLCFLVLIAIFIGSLATFPSKVSAQVNEKKFDFQQSEGSLLANYSSTPPRDSDNISSLQRFLSDLGSAAVLGLLKAGPGIEPIYNQKTGEVAYVHEYGTGVGVQIDKLYAVITDIPVSGSRYIASSLGNMGLNIAQPAYAQGYGFYALDAIQETWRIFRNLAYVFFTILVLAVGFMILFQQKADGQFTVTVQQALPRIVLGLILVSFSYAIAGLMIDAMYLIMYLFGGLFNQTGGKSPELLMGSNIFQLGGNMITSGTGKAFELTNGVTTSPMEDKSIGEDGIFQWLMSGFLAVLGTIIGAIMAIIVFFAMIIAVWKLFKLLLKSYLLVVLNIIFAPLLLLLGAFPNYKGGFKRWFNAMTGNLAAFVAVFILMTVYYFIAEISGVIGTSDSKYFFTPPFIIGVGGTKQAELALAALTLGLLLTMPEIVEKVRKMMGAESGFLGEIAGAAVKKVEESAKGVGGLAAGKVVGSTVGLVRPAAGIIPKGLVGAKEGFNSRGGRSGLDTIRHMADTAKRRAIPGTLFDGNDMKTKIGNTVSGSLIGASTTSDQLSSAIKSLGSGSAVNDFKSLAARNFRMATGEEMTYEKQKENAEFASKFALNPGVRKREADLWIASNPNSTVWGARPTYFPLNYVEKREKKNKGK